MERTVVARELSYLPKDSGGALLVGGILAGKKRDAERVKRFDLGGELHGAGKSVRPSGVVLFGHGSAAGNGQRTDIVRIGSEDAIRIGDGFGRAIGPGFAHVK